MFAHALRSKLLLGLAALFLGTTASPLRAQSTQQCFTLEFYYDSGADDAAGLRAALEDLAEKRPGLKVSFGDLHDDPRAKERVAQIAKYFRVAEVKLPAIYGLNYVVADLQSEEQLRSRCSEILTLTAYVREGCPHCRDAKAFLAKYAARYPALEIVYRDAVGDARARQEVQNVASRYRQSAASLPVMHFCNGLSVGFDREATTGKRILQTLDFWSQGCTVEKKKPQS
jgi:glutaredoxin